MTDIKKKLIEVALPLKAINDESAREKSIRHGHPSTLHLWWARRPLAACRAVLFASLVDDPSGHPELFPTEAEQEAERQRLFDIIEQMVKWENTNNEQVLDQVRAEIMKATNGNPPPVLDPFCGGGSIPLEAQRLGLEAHGSDLNPVAVLITKALIEIPPMFAGRPPVNPTGAQSQFATGQWSGARGLADDIRFYGQWMRDEAEKRIGHLYPKVSLPDENGGGEATVIAWLWARTVKCPNPACGAQMPLVRSFWLSKKKGRPTWVEPVVDQGAKSVSFEVRTGEGAPVEGTKQRGATTCILCGSDNISDATLREQSKKYGVGSQLMAIVAESNKGRIYLPPQTSGNDELEIQATEWLNQSLPDNPRWFSPPGYGLKTYRDLFTPRQLMALTTFSDLVAEAREQVLADAKAAGLVDDGIPLNDGGTGTTAYADAVGTYLAFAIDRSVDRGSTICTWDNSPKMEALRNTFARQAIPMTWDYAEGNPFSASSGNWTNNIEWVTNVVQCCLTETYGFVKQLDATSAVDGINTPLICSDPPYYDNIGYADLSDFFYVWLRRSLKDIFPDICSTILVPKDQELVATPYRFGGNKKAAEQFFEKGLGKSFERMRAEHHPDYPLTLFYAFKQAENKEVNNSEDLASVLVSTGWETMLGGLLSSGFVITGTWPMRSELGNRPVAMGTNALASSIVLVCRPRPADAPIATRREFISALKDELPDSLIKLQHGNIAPVDLAQAAIGPGMAVFSRYSKVVEADGNPMRVRTALALINQVLDEVLAAEEGEYDPSTRWAIAWFEENGFKAGPYGLAETLSKAKNIAVEALADDGFVIVGGGKVRLKKIEELDSEWDPAEDTRLTVWETTHYLIRTLEAEGETGAARLLKKVGGLGETARDLAYRLYTICDRRKWAGEALAYNSLVVAWPEIARLAAQEPETETQTSLEV